MESDKLYKYLRFAIGASAETPEFPTEDELRKLLEIAKAQGLLGMLYAALDRIPTTSFKPNPKHGQVYGSLISAAWSIENLSQKYNSAIAKLSASLAGDGVRSCVLKGQGLTHYYDEPYRRQPGDVDLWVEGSRNHTINYLKSRWKLREVVYHHCEVCGLSKPNVEFHFTPSWMFSPIANRRLQKWFRDKAPSQFSNLDEGLGFCIADTSFNLVFLMIHFYRHLFDEGLKIKQLLDYYYVLKHSSTEQRLSAYNTLAKLGIGKFSAACMYALSYALGMDRSIMICEPDEKAGKRLLQELEDYLYCMEIIRKGEGFFHRVIRRGAHRIKLLFHYPSEVVCAPLFKTVQYIWRCANGYL